MRWGSLRDDVVLNADGADCLVNHGGDALAIRTPRESGRDGMRAIGDLVRFAAAGSDGPQLRDAIIVFHDEGDLGAVGRAPWPMTRALDARILAG